ncbi:MAG: pancreas/duodenum homeobox protein 1 [Desulfobacteraceae bacterium]|nr:pancreas/duodenum homeobox protein 1 [Desulfobacteraceae bacterium]
MDQIQMEKVFTQDYLDSLLPLEKSNQFFEALYGDALEGAYDIRLKLIRVNPDKIILSFELAQRPGKCLVCSLTYGLPNVFERHPIINIKGMVDRMTQDGIQIKNWRFGQTEEQSSELHQIPLYLDL